MMLLAAVKRRPWLLPCDSPLCVCGGMRVLGVCVCVWGGGGGGGGGGEFDNELSISVVSGLKPSTPAKPHGSLTK